MQVCRRVQDSQNQERKNREKILSRHVHNDLIEKGPANAKVSKALVPGFDRILAATVLL
jgi:hypothetical protein